MLDRFAELYLECIPHIDVFATFSAGETYVTDYITTKKIVDFNCLEPYRFENPWSRVLYGKKVLVVHPYAATIEKQYRNREKIFKDPNVLPEFRLETVKAVQSIAGNKPPEYRDWFDALDGMKRQIAEKDFDIALLGCGAYAIPLAKYIKDIGKKSVTVCGALQRFFGIKGSRWGDNDRFYNDYWVRPSDDERPAGANKVEGGCYW